MRKTHKGKPCKRGHDGTRYDNGACVECFRLRRSTEQFKQRQREGQREARARKRDGT